MALILVFAWSEDSALRHARRSSFVPTWWFCCLVDDQLLISFTGFDLSNSLFTECL